MKLKFYAQHYLKKASEGVISKDQAEQLIEQLEKLKKINPQALVENKINKVVNPKTYFQRNTEIVNNAYKLVAFQVNSSSGTQDTIDKARKKTMPVKVFSYRV